MPLVYASIDDLEDADIDEAGANRMIRLASALVTRATKTAFYDTTPAGLPKDADVAALFRDATVTQVLAWHDMGVDPSTGPGSVTTAGKASMSLLSGSVTFNARATAADDAVASVTELVPAAVLILDELPDHAPLVW